MTENSVNILLIFTLLCSRRLGVNKMISTCFAVLSLASMGMTSGPAILPPEWRYDQTASVAYVYYDNEHSRQGPIPLRMVQGDVCKDMCSQSENFSRLEEFRRFADNWNGYGAKPLPDSLINRVKLLLMELHVQPEVFPTAHQGIQIEYDIGDHHIEFEISDDGIVNTMETDNNGDFLHGSFEYSTSRIREAVDQFYARDVAARERVAV